MDTIILEQNNSTFISNIEKDRNFSSLDYLSISNYLTKECESRCIALMNFNLDLLCSDSIVVHNARLIIPLEIFKIDKFPYNKELKIFYNTESFCQDCVTWNSSPSSSFFASIPITRKEIKERYLIMDLTPLICDWLYNNLCNYGIALSVDSADIMIILPKTKIKYSPKLIINYSCKREKNCNTVALYAECTEYASKIIAPDEVFKLNTTRVITPNGISYDTETGIITITQKGYYNLNFTLNLEGSDNGLDCSDCFLNISLKNLTTNVVTDFHMPEVMQGEIHSHSLIYVSQVEEQFVLINSSKKSLQISDLPVQGSLIISII